MEVREGVPEGKRNRVQLPEKLLQRTDKGGVVTEDYEGTLSRLIVLRNELVHVYDEERAKGIFEELKKPEVLETFSAVLNGIKGD